MEDRGESVQGLKEVFPMADSFANVCGDTIRTSICEHVSRGEISRVLTHTCFVQLLKPQIYQPNSSPNLQPI